MKRGIITQSIEEELIREEFNFVLDYVEKAGVTTFSVMFGWNWSSTTQWNVTEFDKTALLDEIARLEAAGDGQIGGDDVDLSVPGHHQEFRFCHESDLHLFFDVPTELTEFFYQRWLKRGFGPVEWEVRETGEPVTRLR